MQTRLRLPVVFSFVLTILLLYFVHYQACRNFLATWLGLSPLVVVQTFSSFSWIFLYLPRNPSRPLPILQVQLPEQPQRAPLSSGTSICSYAWLGC